jgi:hypothetical protein
MRRDSVFFRLTSIKNSRCNVWRSIFESRSDEARVQSLQRHRQVDIAITAREALLDVGLNR